MPAIHHSLSLGARMTFWPSMLRFKQPQDTYFSNSVPLMRNTKKVWCEILQRSQSFPRSEKKLSLFTKQELTLLSQTRCTLVHIDLEWLAYSLRSFNKPLTTIQPSSFVSSSSFFREACSRWGTSVPVIPALGELKQDCSRSRPLDYRIRLS